MRSKEEVGSLKGYGEKVNEAYRTYASVYLDCVDDNLSHFFWRGHDIAPLKTVKDPKDTDAMCEAFLSAAERIICSISHYERYITAYPQLCERVETRIAA